MNTNPTSQFHGSHPRLGNNCHHRQRKDRDPQRLAFSQYNFHKPIEEILNARDKYIEENDYPKFFQEL